MKLTASMLLLCLTLVTSLTCKKGFITSEPRNSLINNAISKIDACTYWGGELGDNSKERKMQIEEGVKRDCPAAEKEAELAYRVYPGDSMLSAKIIELYAHNYYELSGEQKKKICITAAPHFKKLFIKTGEKDPYFEGYCKTEALSLYMK